MLLIILRAFQCYIIKYNIVMYFDLIFFTLYDKIRTQILLWNTFLYYLHWYIESINICFIFLHTWRISRCNLSYRICFIRFIHISILYHLNKQIIASERILTVIIYLKRIIQLDNICIQRENKSILRPRFFEYSLYSNYHPIRSYTRFLNLK